MARRLISSGSDYERRFSYSRAVGASRGLGLEFTRQYAAAGWRVIAGLKTTDSGGFFAYAGEALPW
jgi:hypothetical protein